jgi:hypothetical protein
MTSNSIAANLSQNAILRGSLFPEPIQIILAIPVGPNIKVIGKGVNSGRVYVPILTPEQLSNLYISSLQAPFDSVHPTIRR